MSDRIVIQEDQTELSIDSKANDDGRRQLRVN